MSGSAGKDLKTIGVLINQIEGRYQNRLLKGISAFARDNPVNIFYFIGRALNSPFSEENFHNTIYDLARSRHIDGLIIAAGSLGNYLSREENKSFLSSYSPKPIVTLGITLPGIPGITTDNSTGIKRVVNHLFEDHGFRRIAFAGGPAESQDARARFSSFMQEMKACGLEVFPDLIYQGDFSYHSGIRIASEMTAHGKLNFDAVVCANDDMALGIINTLEKQDILSPRDYSITGFDNVPNARFTSPPLTTVNQPLYEQAYTAGELILNVLNGKSIPEATEKNCRLVIRESCGCSGVPLVRNRTLHYRSQPVSRVLSSVNSGEIIKNILKRSNLPETNRIETGNALSALLETLFLDLTILRDRPLFLLALNEWLEMTFDWNDYTETWHSILTESHSEILPLLISDKTKTYMEDLFQKAFAAVALRTGQKESRLYNRLMNVLSEFRDLSSRLNTAINAENILNILTQVLPESDFRDTALAFHADGARKNADFNEMDLVFYSKNKKSCTEKMRFSVDEILPEEIFRNGEIKERLIMPLLNRDLHFGYILFSGVHSEPLAYDTLREEISQALFTAELFKEQKESENRLQTVLKDLQISEERYRDMARMVPILMIETDLQTQILFINKAAENIIEINDEEKLKLLRPIIVKEDRPKIEAIVLQLKLSKTTLHYPGIRFKNEKTRRIIPVSQMTGIYSKESGELIGLRWNAFDPLPFIKGAILPDYNFYQSKNITKREKEIIEVLIQGMKIRDMAEHFYISESTVKGHISRIYSKFGISSKSELIKQIQEYQIDLHGYSHYLLSVINQLLTLNKE